MAHKGDGTEAKSVSKYDGTTMVFVAPISVR
jgi:hypothetical protein